MPGGTGYIGGRACELLARSGWRVRVASRRGGVWPGDSPGAVSVLGGDWRDGDERARAAEGCEAVLMLAAANEIEAQRDPAAARVATVDACRDWLDTAARQGVRRFVYLSTIHVYGIAQSETPIGEDTPPHPVHPYATTHLEAEAAVREADPALATTVFRLSNAFGAPVDAKVDRWTLLVNDLARQAATTGRLELRSDGLQARDFVPLASVCASLRWSLEADRGSGPFNLGSGESTTVYEMAERVATRCEAVLGFRPPISRPAPAPGARPGSYLLDVGRLARAGGAFANSWDAEVDSALRFCARHFGGAGT